MFETFEAQGWVMYGQEPNWYAMLESDYAIHGQMRYNAKTDTITIYQYDADSFEVNQQFIAKVKDLLGDSVTIEVNSR